MKAAEISVADFRATVAGHLARAQRKIPHVVPGDVVEDAACQPMMDELTALDEYLYGFGQDERVQESRERERQQKTEARKRDLSLEGRMMRLDGRVQSATRLLGGDHCMHQILQPSAVALLVDAMVGLLDAFPAAAFVEPLPGSMVEPPNETVRAIARLMHARRTVAP